MNLFEYVPPTGRQLAQEGIAASADHAEREKPGWAELAYGYLMLYPHQRFMAEDVRRFAERRGLGEPPDARAWGGVMQRASRAKLILKDGYGESGNAQAHCRPTQYWRFK